jgi:hypothetical protein
MKKNYSYKKTLRKTKLSKKNKKTKNMKGGAGLPRLGLAARAAKVGFNAVRQSIGKLPKAAKQIVEQTEQKIGKAVVKTFENLPQKIEAEAFHPSQGSPETGFGNLAKSALKHPEFQEKARNVGESFLKYSAGAHNNFGGTSSLLRHNEPSEPSSMQSSARPIIEKKIIPNNAPYPKIPITASNFAKVIKSSRTPLIPESYLQSQQPKGQGKVNFSIENIRNILGQSTA